MRELEECINLSAWLGCSVDQAFEMFIKKEHLQSWLPMITDVVTGTNGEYNITIEGTRSKQKTTKCKIFAYEPNKYLGFDWIGHNKNHSNNQSDLKIKISVYFLPMDTSAKKKIRFTEVTLTITGLEGNDGLKDNKKWYENTWTNAFENLIEHVNDVFS